MSNRRQLDISQRLGVSQYDDAELVHCINESFPKCHVHGDEVIYAQGDNADWEIKLLYKKAQLAAIIGRIDEEQLSQLENRIKNELSAPVRPAIAQVFMFSRLPVEGYIRIDDCFQMVPPPSSAPKPRFLAADNPFVCQFSFRESSVTWLNASRRHARQMEVGLLLNLLLEFGVHPSLGDGSTWVIRPSSTGKHPAFTSELLQRGYLVDGFAGQLPSFSNTDHLFSLKKTPPDEYYYQLGIPSGRGLEAATDTIELAHKFFALPVDVRKKFTRSMFWFYQGSSSVASSVSAAYIALISAIETLLPAEHGGPACAACGRPLSRSVTSRFVEFMDRHAPKQPVFESARNELYVVRNKLTHGGMLFMGDMSLSVILDPRQAREWALQADAMMLVRVALISWLRTQSALPG